MREELWCRVEAALDARRSPFHDATLAAELDADPASAAAVRRLLASLAHIAAVAPVRRRRRPALVAAAALLVLGATAALFARQRAHLAPRVELEPAAALEMEYTLVVEHVVVPPARAVRVELVPRRILAWTLEGETP